MKLHHTLPKLQPALLTGLLALGISACSLPNNTATKTAAIASGSFSDGEILQVLHTLNEGEIAQAELAVQKSDNPELQDAAEQIIKDHTENNERIESLAQSGIQMEESPLSRGLEMQTEEIREELAELSGTEFECAFLDKQIDQHQLALDTVRKELQPEADKAEIKELLSATAPALQHHLEAAQETRASNPECANS